MRIEDFKEIAPTLPKQPGIYQFLDAGSEILYVGKAKDLKNRLHSYFNSPKNLPHKTRVLVKNADRIEYTIVETEHDALLLENTLIKKFQPRYNVMLKDGKSFSYICIKNERFPRLLFTRKVRRDKSDYFGPYTSKYRANVLLGLIKNIFPLRTCNFNLSEENIKRRKIKLCLEYHIKNCLGPCEELESESEYNEKIQQIKNILKGHFKPVKEHIHKQMDYFADNLNFEKAHHWKEKLKALEDYQGKSTVVSPRIRDVDVFTLCEDEKTAYVNYLKVVNGALINTHTLEMTKNLNQDKKDLLSFAVPYLREKFNSIAEEIVTPFKFSKLDPDLKLTVPQRGDKKKLLDLSDKNVKYFLYQKKKKEQLKKNKISSTERILSTLRDDLRMDQMPFHIECFDNSNIQGAHPVASCVVFRNAKPSKKDYRHYNIKTVEGANDFASMEEIVYRRYKRLLEEKTGLPQLIIIDGGKGLLSAAVQSLKTLNIEKKVCIIGIAKKLEEVYFAGDSVPLYINKKSESLKLIQQARNEAHRFAITFHRQKRSKDLVKTELTLINGVGEKTAKKLLSHFGSVQSVRKASLPEISRITGRVIGRKILEYFQNK